MIVDINKVIVKEDRIRKDFGNIQELADDIKQNGIINPPVINKNYELLAGERRLRACKFLNWKQIEVRMMDTRDAEHELNVEISENDVRKGFTKSERVDYMKRLLRIEQAKAKENMSAGGGSGISGRQKSDNPTRADDVTAKHFEVSRDTMRKEISIVDNKELLDPKDFADWDEGKLSTNKTFQKIKAELAEKEKKIKELESTTSDNRKDKFYKNRIEQLSKENEVLKSKEPQIIEKIVQVIPEDYESLKEAKTILAAKEEQVERLRTQLVELEKTGSDDLIRQYEELQKTLTEKDEEITRLRSRHSSIAREIDTANDFWVKVNSFVKNTLAPFHYDEIITNNSEGVTANQIIEACSLLIEAATDIIRRFETQDVIVVN